MTTEPQKVDVLFDTEVRLCAEDEAGPEPSLRTMIVLYYMQAFDKGQAENLAHRLIEELNRIGGEG